MTQAGGEKKEEKRERERESEREEAQEMKVSGLPKLHWEKENTEKRGEMPLGSPSVR